MDSSNPIKNDLDQIDFNNQVIDLNQPNQSQPTLSSMIISDNNTPLPSVSSSSEAININDKPSEPQVANPNQISPTSLLPTLSSQLISNEKKQEIASNLIDSVGLQVQKTWIDKMLCCLGFLRQYFAITSKEVRHRLIHSIIPFNSGFYEICVKSPDLYGPFWIYTTLIFVIAACGSLSSYFQDQYDTNFYQKVVPIAGSTIYTIGFGLPLLLFVCLKFFGEKISYFSIVCIYGYSLSIFVPITIICACGNPWIHWIFLSYGAGASTSFILVNFWKTFRSQSGNKKYILIAVIVAVQAALFFTMKLYFFETFSKNISPQVNNTPQATPETPVPQPSAGN